MNASSIESKLEVGRWIDDRLPTKEEAEYINGAGFILCVEGRSGSITYHRGVIVDSDNVFEDGKWYIRGVRNRNLKVLAWYIVPEYKEV